MNKFKKNTVFDPYLLAIVKQNRKYVSCGQIKKEKKKQEERVRVRKYVQNYIFTGKVK